MPRVTVTEWLNAIEKPQGPMPPELRHLCYVLARTLPGDGSGAYLGSRAIGERMGLHRSTVSRHFGALSAAGWLELEERRTQFGRKGYRYFAAIPLALLDAPIASRIGAPRSANSGNGASGLRGNGAAHAEIGAADREIGAPGSARLLQTPTEKSAAAPSPAEAGSAAQEQAREIRARVWTLLRAGKSDEQILTDLAGEVSADQVRDWRRQRESMPMLRSSRGSGSV